MKRRSRVPWCQMDLAWSLWKRAKKDPDGELVAVGRVRVRRLRCLNGYFDVNTLEHTPRRARKVFYVGIIEDVVSEC